MMTGKQINESPRALIDHLSLASEGIVSCLEGWRDE
jgi:hypothetical protein